MSNQNYSELDDFAGIALEDSFVLEVTADPNGVRMRVDFVLRPDHPRYQAPPSGEQYCFRTGVLAYQGVQQLVWTYPTEPPAIDANGEIDFGGFDAAWLVSENEHHVEGGWGGLTIHCDALRLGLDP